MNTHFREKKPTVSAASITILEYLERTLAADRNNADQTLTLTHAEIAEKTSYSVKAVQRARLYLEEHGWEVSPGVGTSPTTYRLVPNGRAAQPYAGKVGDGLPLIDKTLRSLAVDGIAQASHADLAQATGLATDTISKAAARLVKDGWEVECGGADRITVYHLPKP